MSLPTPQDISKFLAAPLCEVLIVPLLLMLAGVYARRLGRQDGDTSPGLNDAAVATTTLMMCLGKVAADLPSAVRQTQDPGTGISAFVWLIIVVVAVMVSVDHDRCRSWKRDDKGPPTKEKDLFVGVVVPNLISLIVFALYQAQKLQVP